MVDKKKVAVTGNWLELVMSFFDLAVTCGKNLPNDWESQEEVEAWLSSMVKPQAKVITLLMEDSAVTRLNASKPAVKRGEQAASNPVHEVGLLDLSVMQKSPKAEAGDIDWGMIVDWIAGVLVGMFPEYATVIELVATIVKQLLQIIQLQT